MTLRSPFTCVLWDVDGTVVDASEGILLRLAIALEHFGKPAATRDELVHWIGPPMFDSFQANVGMTPEEATEAVAYYRMIGKADGYTTGARLYPGVGELIADLDAAGIAQATASSKPENQVVALMDHFDLAPHLQALVGATPDEKT
ncbi:MAG TPA: HAD hydrolase-like protein, partial [Microbacterium sp.]|nr:HAD hydrolase-like protein [Microbacterium sp.]